MKVAGSSPHISPSQGEDTSLSSPPPAWEPCHGRQFSLKSNVGASHGLQFFMNCFSLGPFHGTQSFRKRLFQRGSPAGSQVLLANLLQSRVVFHSQKVDIDSLCTSVGCKGTACFTMVCTTGWGTFALTSGTPYSPPFLLVLVSAELFLTHILTSLSG